MKKFLFGMCALLSISLFIGCPTDALNGALENLGAPGFGYITGSEVTASGIQSAIDYAVEKGSVVFLDNVSIDSAKAEVINFKTANVTIAGTLKSNGTGTLVINAVRATITPGANAMIELKSGDAFIKLPSLDIAGSGIVNVAEDGVLPKSGNVAVKNLALSSSAGTDITSGMKVYVFGTLSVHNGSSNPAGDVIAIGKVMIEGNNSSKFDKVNVNAATVSVKGGSASVTLGKLDGTRFSLGKGDKLTVLGTDDITANVKGKGELTLDANVIHAKIDGNGHVVFTGATSSTATKFTASKNSVIAGSVTFKNGLATSDKSEVTLGGNIVLPDTMAITFASITDASVKLKANTVISSAEVPVLSVAADTSLTGTTTADGTITAGTSMLTVATQPVTIDGAVTVNENATLAAASAVTIASGATLVAKGTVDVSHASGTVTVKGTLDATAGSVVAGSTDKVTFSKAKITGDATTGTILKGDGKVTFATDDVLLLTDGGALAIVGNGEATFGATVFNGEGSWTASGVTGGTSATGVTSVTGVTLTSAAEGVKIGLNAGADGWKAATLTADKTPVITQKKAASNALVIGANITLNLKGTGTAKAGEIVLVADSSDAGKLAFAANSSKILIGAGAGGSPITGTTDLKIGGIAVVTDSTNGLTKNDFQVAGGKLVQLGGTTASYLTAKDTVNVLINSTVDASGT
jgi:hypothetical protein